jgi:hypothetical protein
MWSLEKAQTEPSEPKGAEVVAGQIPLNHAVCAPIGGSIMAPAVRQRQ